MGEGGEISSIRGNPDFFVGTQTHLKREARTKASHRVTSTYFACHGAIDVPEVLFAGVAILHAAHRLRQCHVDRGPSAVLPRPPGRLPWAPGGGWHPRRGRCPGLGHVQGRAQWTHLLKDRGHQRQARRQPIAVRLDFRPAEEALQSFQQSEALRHRQKAG